MKFMQRGMSTGAALFVLLLVVLGVWGWVLNLIHVFHESFSPLTGKVALEVVGIFLPLIGAVLGWVT